MAKISHPHGQKKATTYQEMTFVDGYEGMNTSKTLAELMAELAGEFSQMGITILQKERGLLANDDELLVRPAVRFTGMVAGGADQIQFTVAGLPVGKCRAADREKLLTRSLKAALIMWIEHAHYMRFANEFSSSDQPFFPLAK